LACGEGCTRRIETRGGSQLFVFHGQLLPSSIVVEQTFAALPVFLKDEMGQKSDNLS
jgi:hypothetical protein